MLEEIYNLAASGQFEDAEEDNVEIVSKLPDNKVIEDQSDSEEIDYENYDDFENIELNKKDLKQTNTINYNNWADKMDFMKVKSVSSKSTDKSDNATSDRVLDDRSCKIMHKMIRQNVFQCVKGNISAGKEANVYYAPHESEDLVIKVYMTSIMPFKARNKYMEGDFRFKNSNLSSSTKLVTTWAEKEFRNLLRIYETNGAIPCPRPVKQKAMVLVMTMIGGLDGQAAPKLKDLELQNEEEWLELYEQIVSYVRILFQECRLIHADLSEYNLLYHDNKVWMIDVSQSVEHFHPEALNFLRKDCNTVNTFFRNKGVRTLSLREFFDFVVDPTIVKHTDENFRSYIHQMINNSEYCMNNEDDSFFLNCHIPRNLSDVLVFVKDYKKLRQDADYVINCPYASVTGMTRELKDIRLKVKESIKTHKRTLKQLKNQLAADELEEQAELDLTVEDNLQENDNELQESANNDQSCDSRSLFKRPDHESKEDKKSRKKLVKEVQRERRVENKKKIIAEKARTIPGFKNKKLS